MNYRRYAISYRDYWRVAHLASYLTHKLPRFQERNLLINNQDRSLIAIKLISHLDLKLLVKILSSLLEMNPVNNTE